MTTNVSHKTRARDRILSTTRPEAEPTGPSIEEASTAVIDFLKRMPDVKYVRVRKLVRANSEKGMWEAEADVFVPSDSIRALALPLRRKVLEPQTYLLTLDSQLNVTAYGLRESFEASATARSQ